MKDLRTAQSLTIEEMAGILKIGRTKAYEFVNNNPPFTVVTIDNKLKRISAKSFFSWLDGEMSVIVEPGHFS